MKQTICKFCKEKIIGKTAATLGAHVRNCVKNPNRNNSIKKCLETKGLIKKEYKFNCKKCNDEYTVLLTDYTYNNGKYRRFCNRSCANSREFTIETRNKIKETLTKTPIIKICKECKLKFEVPPYMNSRIFCSQKCSSIGKTKNINVESCRKGGLKSAKIQSKIRRSKNEIHFAELCKSYFNNVKMNKQMFNGWDADVIIEDIKTAVLWNGKWHYEKITKKHSVKQVQNRDKIKIKEIKKCGYDPYVIKDMGSENKKFVIEEFNKFIAGS